MSGTPQAEVEPPLILRAEAASARNLLQLLLPVPEYADFGADRAAVAFVPFQAEFDPVISRIDVVHIQQNGSVLVSDYSIKRTVIIEVGQRHGAAVVTVSYSY
jgi:hypothetical protein